MRAPVGHAWMQTPHETHELCPSSTSYSATSVVLAPRSCMPSVKQPTSSLQARTQRRQRMQRLLSSTKFGCDESTTKGCQAGWMGQLVMPSPYAAFCSSQSPPLFWQYMQ